jgi:hypothetical protein
MAKYLKLVGWMLMLAAGAAYAAPILVTSPGALAPNDSVVWSQLGGDGSTIPGSFSATSTGGRSISGSLGGSDGCVAVVGGSVCGWVSGPGFGAGNFLIWAEDSSGAGSGPLSLGFPSVLGAGLWLQANAAGQFAAQILAYNGATLLGTFGETSDAGGDGIFIGVLDTIADITKIVVSLTSCTQPCDSADFAVNSLLLKGGRVVTVPEPTSLSLLLLGAGGLAFFRRARRAGRTDVTQEKTA